MADIYVDEECSLCGRKLELNDRVVIHKTGTLASHHNGYFGHPNTNYYSVNYIRHSKAVPNALAFHPDCINNLIIKEVERLQAREVFDSIVSEIKRIMDARPSGGKYLIEILSDDDNSNDNSNDSENTDSEPEEIITGKQAVNGNDEEGTG